MAAYTGKQIIETEFMLKSNSGLDFSMETGQFEPLPKNSTIYIACRTNPAHPISDYPFMYGDWYLMEDTDIYIVTNQEIEDNIYPANVFTHDHPPLGICHSGRHWCSGLVLSPDNLRFRYFNHGTYNRIPKAGASAATLPSFIIPPLKVPPGLGIYYPDYDIYPEYHGLYREGIHYNL